MPAEVLKDSLTFLGVFAKLRKATVSFGMSVSQSVSQPVSQ